YMRMCQREEADKEFLRMLSVNKDRIESTTLSSIFTPIFVTATTMMVAPLPPISCDYIYISRQTYLRSYPFTKKETLMQRIKKCLKEKKKRLKRNALKNALVAIEPFSFIDSIFKSAFSCLTRRR
ncbi:hypothetical protein U1Q18_050192, partial [Sarracenia purpurea var. burkii]